jgi:hypothetical protein
MSCPTPWFSLVLSSLSNALEAEMNCEERKGNLVGNNSRPKGVSPKFQQERKSFFSHFNQIAGLS